MLLFNRVANQIFYHKSHFLYFVYLCFADIPELLITFEPSMSIHEGSSLCLCCISNNSLPNETITWFNTKVGRQDRPNPTTACIHFVKVSRNYSGIYTCKAEQDGQRFTANICITYVLFLVLHCFINKWAFSNLLHERFL